MELVKLTKIKKYFSGVRALDGVEFTLNSHECLALVGENGAGKSTLMKVLSGVYPAGTYEGQIEVSGKAASFSSPLDATSAGIAIIHQELSPFLDLTVAENLYVGQWPTKNGLVDWKEIQNKALLALGRVGANCSPHDTMRSLSVGNQQLVEIAKALDRNSRILILDEPTSALTPPEVKKLFSVLNALRAQGVGIVYISHKMDEIFEIADRFTILRDGKSVYSGLKTDLNEAELIRHMVGRNIDAIYPPRPARDIGEPVLELNQFSFLLKNGKNIGPVNFKVKKGEIVGLSGLLGSGRSELLRCIFGEDNGNYTGEIRIQGHDLKPKTPRQGLRQNIGFVSEDRKLESIFPGRSLVENEGMSRLVAARLFSPLSQKWETAHAKNALQSLRTKYSDSNQPIESLSGGNQQKVVFARALDVSPKLILLDEPTRGVDVGAKFEIYEILFGLAKEGRALLVASSELPELMGICDRIEVMSEGKHAGTIDRNNFSQERIMQLAISGRR